MRICNPFLLSGQSLLSSLLGIRCIMELTLLVCFVFIFYFVLRFYALAYLIGRVFLYLGSSNSQMRDQGCYFLNADDNKLEEFRQSLGRFEGAIKSVPKVNRAYSHWFLKQMLHF